VRSTVRKVWSNYFPVSAADSTLAFYCGAALMEVGSHDEALSFFEISVRELGPSTATSYNMGLCHERAGRRAQALASMDQACGLDPSFEPAIAARNRLRS
jgi:Tfp pilus assembly protein PilF